MGKLQDNIQALINAEYGRGLDGSKIAKRLIEAGLSMMADEGDLYPANRIVPDFDGNGEFVEFHISTFTPAVAEGETATGIHHLTQAFGEFGVNPGQAYHVVIDEDGQGFDVSEVLNINPDVIGATFEEAAETFDSYARHHIAKGPEHFDKARRNIAMAAKCYAMREMDYTVPMIPSEGTAFLLDDLAAVPAGQGLQDADTTVTLPVERLTAITGDIPEAELIAQYLESKARRAINEGQKAGNQDTKDRLEWAARVFNNAAEECRQGLHLPIAQIDGRVIPYNEDRDTGIRHAANLRLFFQDVHARNVKAGWWSDITTGEPKKRSVGELLMLFITEIAEAYDAYMAEDQDDKLPQYPGFGVEMADLGIRWADLCGAAMAGRLVDYSAVPNPGDEMFRQVAEIARNYEAIRKTPEAIGAPEEGGPLPAMDIAEMADAKLDFNAKREDHKIENRLKDDGKRT